MKHSSQSKEIKNIVISGLIIFFMLLFVFFFVLSTITKNHTISSAIITLIPYYVDPLALTPSKTPESITLTQQVNPSAVFAKGMTICINGTGGDGLRLRDIAGQNGLTIYIAAEGQEYTIIDGPDLKDGFVWWRIINNQNGEIIGWAVQDFMTTNQYD